MAEKKCLQQKHDLEVNWLKASNFIPNKDEVVIYDAEITEDGDILTLPADRTIPFASVRLKIGDGKTRINDLPFIGQTSIQIITWEADD